jgi:hypothetical protein
VAKGPGSIQDKAAHEAQSVSQEIRGKVPQSQKCLCRKYDGESKNRIHNAHHAKSKWANDSADHALPQT